MATECKSALVILLKFRIKMKSTKSIVIGCVCACLVLIFTNSISAQEENTPLDSERIYRVWDNEPAPNRGGDFNITKARGYPYDEDWELRSYPIGNGYMGANIFGRTDTERIQLTEKTLANEGLYGIGGLTSFAEINLEFNHENPTNYSRSININEAISYVNYISDGVEYTREYFISYPDNVLVIKLSANKKGKISFLLKPEIPYLRDSTQKNTRTGKMEVHNDLITLSGFIEHFSVNYEGQIKVITDGGKLSSAQKGDKAEINVSNANSAVLIIAAGTNYKLCKELFLEDVHNKKLDPKELPHNKVSALVNAAAAKGFDNLKEAHLRDYQNLFSRVELQFTSETPQIPTKELLENYQSDASNHYLEELMFHYGRYLLISTSRKGTLPCGLQGVWSQYEVTPFTGGFWHNINIQMNYWGAFNSNLAETFTPYVEFFDAYLPKAKSLATDYLKKHNPNALAKDSLDNGWTIGTGTTPHKIVGPGGHSGPGTGALTTKMFWDYYEFTMDTTFLREKAYPAILGMSKFLSKTLVPVGDSLLLVNPSASPEQKHNGENYITAGTTFDQELVWENHNDLLKASKILNCKDDFIEVVQDEITKLDPIIIGKSGQVKEFREEEYYGEIGQKQHRHISHLCALYPGTLINSTTKDWMNASIVTLDLRGNNTTGWAMAHRMNARARTKDGEKAHEVYTKFIKERTLPNLWTTHPPFQIDGNFGCMAGVAEMLLQSHEGYIEPLAALPKVWSTGEYSGLVARGNFEITVKWKNGKATSIEVLSRSGGECKLKYKGIAKATVTDKVGVDVHHKSLSSELISIETEKGKTYLITINDASKQAKTVVGIQGEKFLINNEFTYKGREWNGFPIEGLLMNSRMVQGIFDDLNTETAGRWKYDDTQKWDADRNTNEFVNAMESWYTNGLLAFTVNMQGGSPLGYGNKGWINSAYKPNGELRPEYMSRLKRIIDRADELGMVVILGLFYNDQEDLLEDENAVLKGVDNVLDWLHENQYQNVIIEVNNECNLKYKHEILQPHRVHEVIERIKSKKINGHSYLASASYSGGRIPTENVVQSADFILIHGNGVYDPARIGEMVKETKQVEGYTPKPILFNEDDHFDFNQTSNNLVEAVRAYASWGYFDYRMKGEGFDNGFQSVPVNWQISSPRKKAFFNKLKEITGGGDF